jgi:K(+)-stimulated pyrophosphate-energized sodium pump
METMNRLFGALASTRIVKGALLALLTLACASPAMAGEAELKIPVLGGSFLGMSGHNLLLIGLVICLLGVGFGLVQYSQIRKLPVHKSMLEISELIYETCKTYLVTQIKFISILWAFIAVIMIAYFKYLSHTPMGWGQVIVVLLFSVIGILGSVAVALRSMLHLPVASVAAV